MSSRQVRMIAPSGYNGAALMIGDKPDLPAAMADRLVARGRAVEIDAPEASVEVEAPAKRKRNRGAAAVADAPAADPAEAIETGASAAPGADLPEIGETD